MTQGEALVVLKTGANVFLTGEPGSGKTHAINEFVAWLRASGIEPSITAATGIAATHVGGMTLHSWSGIGIAESLSPADVDRIASKEHIARRIGKAKVLIIEEISMLSAATFEMVDAVCREVRRVDTPFGGLVVVLVGDFFQLPPVSRARELSFAYESATWREFHLLTCYLTEQFRQDDSAFLEVLSAIRSGTVEALHHESLAAREVARDTVPADMPKLFSHNADVDMINAAELAKLAGKSRTFRMTTKGKDTLVEGLKRGCLSPELLELKEGAAVMFTKNSPQAKFVNGTLGAVAGWGSDGMPVVQTKDGRRIATEPMEWQFEEQGKVKASVAQIPLRLAYAMTVHKSQGMSMDAAVMDLSKAFEYGQGYVALSRVRRLSGVYLTGLNARALEVHPEVLEKDKTFRAASEAATDAFAQMPQAEIATMQKKFVKAMGGAWFDGKVSRTKKGRAKTGVGLPGRLAETLQAVRDGKTLKSVAKERGLAVSTIVTHLEELASIGKLARADFIHLVPTNVLDEIHEVLAGATDDKLAPIFHALGGRYSFEAIRLTRLARDR
ncbi:AAA family ATPase [Candidatus Kaiserbacteria bacterium CG10_big_fil_rev_8_21_14_0_10_56_12]|uniref:AAA family ATPase n=1 Tax=Candidatus Kaiserbacteria bacterium CG10_big_fil_rev_8_21_14_0_10_56_12 TaxID=1974611 RepID=A0A2H0UA62_9BACT|nr:MAG: AAA family ATPase [Candidatus Kaiserbacteria bacterium CG10_big_fil_rev_8_21_14_0_10_56_12]